MISSLSSIVIATWARRVHSLPNQLSVNGSIQPYLDNDSRPFLNETIIEKLIEIPILSVVPFTGGWTAGGTFRIAGEIAMDIINTQQLILPGYKLHTTWDDDHCDDIIGPQKMMDHWFNDARKYVAFGGHGCSAVCIQSQSITQKIRLPFISYGCGSGALSNTVKHPGFARFLMEERTMGIVFKRIGAEFQWKKIAIVVGEQARFYGPAEDLVTDFRGSGIDVEIKNNNKPNWNDLLGIFMELKQERQRAIVVLGYEPFYRQSVCASKAVGIPKGVIWMSVGWHKNGWWEEKDTLLQTLEPSCTPELVTEYYNGGFGVAGLGAPPDSQMDLELECLRGFSSRSIREELAHYFAVGYPVGENLIDGGVYLGLQGAAMDGICIWAYMVRNMLSMGYTLEQLQKPTDSTYQEVIQQIKKKITFSGVSGSIRWDGNNLPGLMQINQVQHGKNTYVASVSADGVDLTYVEGMQMIWGDGTSANGSSFLQCPEGQVMNTEGICKSCGIGKFHNLGDDSCTDCSEGKYCNFGGQLMCQTCTKGKYSNLTGQSTCRECGAGKFAEVSQQSECASCPVGQYADKTGSSKCVRCDVGKYINSEAATDCETCGPGKTTKGQGNFLPEDCVCNENTYLDSDSDGCFKCTEGTACDVGSEFPPPLLFGYWSSMLDPLDIFKCEPEENCLGGAPEACAGGRIGFVCARCPIDYKLVDDWCQPCEDKDSVFASLFFLGYFFFPLVLYRCVNGEHRWKLLPLENFIVVLETLLEVFQVVAVAATSAIVWPRLVIGIIDFFGAFAFEISSLVAFECMFAHDKDYRQYLPSSVIIPGIVVEIWAVYFLTQMLPGRYSRFKMKTSFTWNLSGKLYNILYVSQVSLGMVPFVCYPHPEPNKMSSVSSYAGTICYEGDWGVMAMAGIFSLILSVLFFAYLSFELWRAPRLLQGSKRSAKVYMQYITFLVEDFRVDVYYWNIPMKIQEVLLSVVFVIAGGSPLAQSMFLTCIYVVSLGVMTRFWPYKPPLLNAIVCLTYMILIMVLISSGHHLDTPFEDEIGAKVILFFLIIGLLGFGIIIAIGIVNVLVHGRSGSLFAITMLRNTVPNIEQISKLWDQMTKVDQVAMREYLNSAQIYDIIAVERLIPLLLGHGAAKKDSFEKHDTFEYARSSASRQSSMYLGDAVNVEANSGLQRLWSGTSQTGSLISDAGNGSVGSTISGTHGATAPDNVNGISSLDGEALHVDVPNAGCYCLDSLVTRKGSVLAI